MALEQSFYPMDRCLPTARWRRGLTTAEMLVTVGILALLMGITLPAISAAKRSQARAQCASNLHSIGLAFSLYIQDYRDSYPVATSEAQWEDLLRPYTPRTTFHCPSDNELFAALSSSYDWRDTGNPNTTLAGRLTIQLSHTDVSLAYDALPEWHQKGRIQVLRANQSVELMDLPSFFKDMERSPVGP